MGREVTVATLIYRSPEWLRFTLEQLALATNDVTTRVLVVGNDANTRVMEALPRLHGDFNFDYIDHRNADPYAYNMGRVYAAHNRCMEEAKTEDVILINSDMSFADHWADELLAMRDEFPCVPTSLLIESGRVPSGLPTYVRDFGRHWSTFDRAGFLARAEQIRDGCGQARRMESGLFMPVLFKKLEFFKARGYEIQKVDHVLASDAVLFQKLDREFHLRHVTAVRSVCYHMQRGEMEDDIA